MALPLSLWAGLTLVLVSLSACAADPLIIAHRGASYDAPENTLASVNLAWERESPAVEIDVYLTRDGRIVVFHDRNTKRLGKRDRMVRDQTLEELRQLDVGSHKGPKWVGEGIPTLEEVLATVPENRRLFVEIKCGPEILPVIEEVVGRSGLSTEEVVFICFDWEVIKATKERFPEFTAYWLVGIERDKETGSWNPTTETMIDQALEAGVDGLNVNACGLVDRGFVEAVHGAGLSLYVWTVNDADEARRLELAGVDGITTDRPRWLRNRLEVMD